jgi:TrmH family RNA methyltransferase
VEVERVFGLVDDHEGARLAARAGAAWVPVTPEVLDRLAPTEHPRGPVAVFTIPAPDSPSGADALVLWELGDPGNAGTIIRTGAAFGVAVAATPGTVDLWSPKTLRAAAGAHFSAEILTLDTPAPDGLRAAGFSIAATAVAGGEPPEALASLPGPVAVLIGSEAGGLPAAALAAADLTITIPMRPEVESLNAAMAAAIIANELYRLRCEPPPVTP